jgi:hypothetical protein
VVQKSALCRVGRPRVEVRSGIESSSFPHIKFGAW